MDTGFTLYLYISKTCHPNYLLALFGREKVGKGEALTEQMIEEQQNKYS